jgi:hypothetical protein
MSTTLYILRQQPDHISPALFRKSDADIDVILLEHAASIAPSFIEKAVVSGEGIAASSSHRALTYGDFVEKIFLSNHVIVL